MLFKVTIKSEIFQSELGFHGFLNGKLESSCAFRGSLLSVAGRKYEMCEKVKNSKNSLKRFWLHCCIHKLLERIARR